MARIRLVHWHAAEAHERARRLRADGHVVNPRPMESGSFGALRKNPPDAFVIDLGRLPSHGRAVAAELRSAKATRHVPLVFVDGKPEKVAIVRKILPDAHFTTWGRIATTLKRALARPPVDPVVPQSISGYSGTPLPKKLGIKPGFVVALVSAPDDFERTLGTLPDDVTLRRQARGKPDLVVWFVTRSKALSARVDRLGALAGSGGLWIAWPKQASGKPTDLTQARVRKTGLDAGLVDYKICAIDATWSGLRFARRKS